MAEIFGAEQLPDNAFPLTHLTMRKFQCDDVTLLNKVQTCTQCAMKPFHGGRRMHHLICKNGEICLPKELQECTVNWCHTQLVHSGVT